MQLTDIPNRKRKFTHNIVEVEPTPDTYPMFFGSILGYSRIVAGKESEYTTYMIFTAISYGKYEGEASKVLEAV